MTRGWMAGVAADVAALAIGSAAGIVAFGAVSSNSVTVVTAAPQAARMDIVDAAVGAGQFTAPAGALDTSGLVSTLQGPGPFTVFAPTDAAFATIPAATLAGLPTSPDQLRAVLTYHVVPGSVMGSNDVIHAIDTVSLPLTQAARPAMPAPAATGMLGAVERESGATSMAGVLAVITMAGVGAARLALVRSALGGIE